MNCKNCGAILAEGQLVCPNCNYNNFDFNQGTNMGQVNAGFVNQTGAQNTQMPNMENTNTMGNDLNNVSTPNYGTNLNNTYGVANDATPNYGARANYTNIDSNPAQTNDAVSSYTTTASNIMNNNSLPEQKPKKKGNKILIIIVIFVILAPLVFLGFVLAVSSQSIFSTINKNHADSFVSTARVVYSTVKQCKLTGVSADECENMVDINPNDYTLDITSEGGVYKYTLTAVNDEDSKFKNVGSSLKKYYNCDSNAITGAGVTFINCSDPVIIKGQY